MVILDVIPLIPLPRNQPPIVSYFHGEALPRGSVVQVLFNNRKIKAVVIGSDDIRHRKEMLKKQATFTLKKIEKVLKNNISEEQIKKAQDLAEYYFMSLGICMRAIMLHPDEKNYKKYLATGPVLDLEDVKIENVKNIKIADMRREIRDANFSIFSRHLKEALQVAHEQHEKLIIFIPRLGYANLIFCKSCGYAFKCKNCSASLIAYENALKCHHCNYEEARPKQCPNCKSYDLKAYGIGIDKVEAELKKFFSYQNLKIPVIEILSSDTKKLPDTWDILLATQSLFKYSKLLKIPYLAIINADALIHIPDYRAEENLLRQTLLLASMTDHLLIQTYNPDDPALVAAATGKVEEFMKQELENRKSLGYPPFMQLVKLQSRNRNREMLRRNALGLAQQLGGTAYPALIDRERGMYVYNILLKFPNDATRDTLHATLDRVPPDWQVDVDPINIV
ncbi:MAG: hypothetical protein AAB483_03030 [Patescibacteria group bacterium]